MRQRRLWLRRRPLSPATPRNGKKIKSPVPIYLGRGSGFVACWIQSLVGSNGKDVRRWRRGHLESSSSIRITRWPGSTPLILASSCATGNRIFGRVGFGHPIGEAQSRIGSTWLKIGQVEVNSPRSDSSLPPWGKVRMGESSVTKGNGLRASREPRTVIKRVRELRKSPSAAEWRLWAHLRYRQVNGHRFRRQHPIGWYIVDFACFERRLVVEVEGGQHAGQQAYDATRSDWLQDQGYNVLRFWNNQVMEDIESVKVGILQVLESQETPPP